MSRPDRWMKAVAAAEAALNELKDLQDEYQDWLDNLPEGLQDGATADKLNEVVDLEVDYALELVGEFEAVDLPRGFGRD